VISLNDTERQQLERWRRGHQTPRSLAERAQIILLAAGGAGAAERHHRGTVALSSRPRQ
jgi:hypothetical protein